LREGRRPRPRWSAALLAVAPVIAWGQPAFQNLASNADGSVLWFSSSLRMKGGHQFAHPKILVWSAADGVRLYDQKPASIAFAGWGASSWSSATAYNLHLTSPSVDGRTVAVTGVRDCNFGSLCGISIERYGSEIRFANGETVALNGSASLSPNGRFAYLASSVPPLLRLSRVRLRDLTTGRQAEFETSYAAAFRHRVANDGTTLVSKRDGPKLRKWPSGEEQRIALTSEPSAPMINSSATRVAGWTGGVQGRIDRLVALHLQTAVNPAARTAYVEAGAARRDRNAGRCKPAAGSE
ncbi:MAG: hypothetical protein ACRD8O_00175, partial [Bryobacteraceae bacterium]